jgi:formyltetrahydrofolate deformylase
MSVQPGPEPKSPSPKAPSPKAPSPKATARLLVACPNQPGIVAAVAEFIYRHGGDIVHAAQHTELTQNIFFQRVEFFLEHFDLERADILPAMSPIVERFGMDVTLRYSDETRRLGVLASRQPHCLYDLLARWSTGELQGEIVTVISNHPDHAEICEHFGVPYHHLPVSAETRAAQEAKVIEVLDEARVELVVMARYMQVLSPELIAHFPARIINIHHSFLPAFIGGRPYHQAYDRGVKLIGVTAHYATSQLDEGPIIEQDVVRVSHRDTVADLTSKGRDMETVVLARAIGFHLADNVLVYGNKTVVFS